MHTSNKRRLALTSAGFVVLLAAVAAAIWSSPAGSDPEAAASDPTTTTVVASTTVTSTTTTTVPPSTTTIPGPLALEDLVGEYRGTLTREDEPGTPNTFQLVKVEILNDGDTVVGQLTHGPVSANSLDAFGNVIMPLSLSLEDDRLMMRWDQSVGSYEDTTFAAGCLWEAWEMNLIVVNGGDLLELIDGYVSAQLSSDSEVTEWYAGCPADERAIIRLTLARQ